MHHTPHTNHPRPLSPPPPPRTITQTLHGSLVRAYTILVRVTLSFLVSLSYPVSVGFDLYMMMIENAPPQAVWERAPASPCCFSPPFHTIHSGLLDWHHISLLSCSDPDFSARAFNLGWPTGIADGVDYVLSRKFIIAFHMLSVAQSLFAFGKPFSSMVFNNNLTFIFHMKARDSRSNCYVLRLPQGRGCRKVEELSSNSR